MTAGARRAPVAVVPRPAENGAAADVRADVAHPSESPIPRTVSS
jgi:hypothetical protein